MAEEFKGYLDNIGLKYLLDNYIAKKTETNDALAEAKEYADDAIAALVKGAPEALDTLAELAAALDNNEYILDAYYTKTQIDAALDEKSDSTHTHEAYLTVEGTAAAAKKLTTTKEGSETEPVYFKNGVPVKTTYSLAANVPADAKFTDTTYNNATTSVAGLMSVDDKKKLDGIAANANNYTYTLPTASSSTLGGIKTNYTSSGKSYAVKVDDNGNAYVHVPWEAGGTTVQGDYVPLSGGTMTGALQSTELRVRNSSSAYPSVNFYSTDGYHAGSITQNATDGNRHFYFKQIHNDQNGGNYYADIYNLPKATAGLTGNKTYNILTDKNTITIAQGGTGATTAQEAVHNLIRGNAIAPSIIELWPPSNTATHGGYLDFHFNQASDDYTSRIIESAKGELSINVLGNVRVGNITYGNWKGSAIPVANGGTGATDRRNAFYHLAFLGTEPVKTIATDTVTKWIEVGSGYAFYMTNGLLNNQPSQYGLLINYVFNSEIFQIWNTQMGGPTYFRSGNASGWADTGWRKVFDSANYPNGIQYGNASLDVSINNTPIIWARNNGKTSWSLERNDATQNTMVAHYYDEDGNWTTSGFLLDHSNFATYVTPSKIEALPISGGTLTGVLTLKGSQYGTDATTGGLNCNNSTITQVNAIYFADTINSLGDAGEGINFVHGSGGTYDTLYAISGDLKFAPNRTLGTVGTSYTVYHTGNKPTASDVGAVPTSRTVNGKTLSSNIALSATDVGAIPTTIAIAASTDLNTITTPGFYYCAANATVATLANTPTINAFYMEVGKHAGVYQRIVEYTTAGAAKIYIRNYYANTWSTWGREYTTWDKPAAYSLPTASSSTLGGVKTTSTVTSTSGLTACPIIGGVPYYKDTNTQTVTSVFGRTGAITLTKADVTTALGYTPPTANTTYSAGTGIIINNNQISIDYATAAVSRSKVPYINSDGVMEIGRFVDFHHSNNSSSPDFSARLYVQDSQGGNTLALPKGKATAGAAGFLVCGTSDIEINIAQSLPSTVVVGQLLFVYSN